MKVLILTETDHSISKRYWEQSLPLLRQKGVDARLATVRKKGDLQYAFEKNNIPTYAFNAERATDYFRVSKELAELARQEKFDIIHAHESIAATICGFSAIWQNPSKRIFNRHHNIMHGKQRFLSFLGSHLSHMIMPVSKSCSESAQVFDKAQPNKIVVAYNGIDELRSVKKREVEELRVKLNIPENAKVISIVAHLREEKGHQTLLEACRLIANQITEPLHLVIVGSGSQESKLKEIASANREFTTHFVGHQSDIALWLALADVVAMPSYHEAFGLSAIEAMSCGKPLVASRIGGLIEVIEDRDSGILVSPQSVDELANALLLVLNSPSLAAELGSNARKRYLEKFTMDKMVDGWIRCYQKILTGKQNDLC